MATRQETAMPGGRFEERPWCRDCGLYLLNQAEVMGVRFSYVHSSWGTTRAGVTVEAPDLPGSLRIPFFFPGTFSWPPRTLPCYYDPPHKCQFFQEAFPGHLK